MLDTISHLLSDQPLANAPIKEPKQYKLTVLVGHDTNIASIAGALNLKWQLTNQPDNTPPGGGIIFERWRKADGSKEIRLKILYQTLPDMRANQGHKIVMDNISIPNCGNPCTPDSLQQLIRPVLVPSCLPENYLTPIARKD